MKKHIIYILALMISVLFSACSDDNEILEENKPLHEKVTETLKEKMNNSMLPEAILTNSDENAKNVVSGLTDFKDITNEVLGYLEVPKNTISSTITDSKEQYNWLDIVLGDAVEVDYTIEKEADKFSFIYNISTGSQSLDFLKGNTSTDQKSGIIVISESNTAASLTWEITADNILILELLSPGIKSTLQISTLDKSGKITYSSGISYEWFSDGSGKKIDENKNEFTW
jgi:PBP1b-binding outer membrane lipoprotein LpoB